MHWSNTYFPIFPTGSISAFLSDVQFAKAYFPSSPIVLGTVILVKPVQFANAFSPIVSTDDGTTNVLSALHP